MKNIFKSSLLLLGALVMFTACSDDRDSNPTIKQPSTFVLNTPAYANAGIDLANSQTIPFTWSQPDYGGFPVAAEYQLEVSTTGNFTISTSQAAADETGETIADYAILDDVFNTCKGDISAEAIDKAIVEINGWTEDEVPETVTLYVRAKASTIGAQDVYSNTVQLTNVIPYYIELANADLEWWYLIGEAIGDGSWNNSVAGLGTAIYTMYPVKDAEYDAKTGQGLLEYIGFFGAGQGFKLIKTPGSWDDQWGAGNDGFVKNDGGSGNLSVEEDGYYRVLLDTKNGKLTIEKYEGDVTEFSQIAMPGAYQGVDPDWWDVNRNLMTASNKLNWAADLSISEDTQMKFAANGGWDYNWGAAEFPYGFGQQGGSNIEVPAGDYKVFLNTVTGAYRYIKIGE